MRRTLINRLRFASAERSGAAEFPPHPQLGDFERRGNRWLGLFRNWIIETNQALNLANQENPIAMKDFLAAIGSNRRLASGTLVMDFKKPFSSLAETHEKTRSVRDENFVNAEWWTEGESDSRLRNANAA